MTGSKGSVLVVDDDDDIRELMTLVLQSRGYDVSAASDGHRALDALRRDAPPDLVLLDLRMPHMAGDELVSVVREDPSLAETPIVVVSGDSTARHRAAALPVQDCLIKPVDLSQLLSTVRRYTDGG